MGLTVLLVPSEGKAGGMGAGGFLENVPGNAGVAVRARALVCTGKVAGGRAGRFCALAGSFPPLVRLGRESRSSLGFDSEDRTCFKYVLSD